MLPVNSNIESGDRNLLKLHFLMSRIKPALLCQEVNPLIKRLCINLHDFADAPHGHFVYQQFENIFIDGFIALTQRGMGILADRDR